MTLLLIIFSSLFISAGAFGGALLLVLNRHRIQALLLPLVSLSAGTLMGGAFLHLLPEAVEAIEPQSVFLLALLAFVGFFLIERVLHWHHCHDTVHEHHYAGTMNLLGDSVHNFLDGLILAAAYSVSTSLGVATTLAIALHEIPQEISDFGVLLHSGWQAKKALLMNYLVALMIVVGAIAGYLLADRTQNISAYLMPVAAGGFIYIAAADLVPELRQERKLASSLLHISVFVLGVVIMYVLSQAE